MFNFFKKNNAEETIENVEKSTFMKLWHNKRTHAAMVLGMWMIFLAFVMIISFIGGEATKNEALNGSNLNEEEVLEFKDLTEMQSEILKNNYKYVYNVKIGEYQVIYKGEKLNDNETGYRETKEETIKYYIDETGLYKVVMDELSAFDKLYENINESYIDLEYIFELIKDKAVMSEENDTTKTYTYNFFVDTVNYEVKVITDLENITKINIIFEDKEYTLSYIDINTVEKLSYEIKEVNE